MQSKINWKIILRNSLLSVGLVIIASFFYPLVGYFHSTLPPSRGTGVIALLLLSVIPIFFLSLLNLLLSKNVKSLAGSLLVLAFLLVIIIFYKLLPINSLTNVFIILLYLIPVSVIAATRAVNMGGGYKEVIIGAVLGFIIGIFFLVIFFTLFLLAASLFVDITQPLGYFANILLALFTAMPLGFLFWFFISLGEQVYLRKQKVA